jgi:hypothetical protein
VNFGNVVARTSVDKSGKQKTLNLSKKENDRLVEAQTTFRGLAADMRAFANGEPLANRIVNWFGYDANKIANLMNR